MHYKIVSAILTSLFVHTYGIVGGIPADMPPEDDPVVYLRFAGRAARITGVHDFPHYVFRGIRFAQPPTGRDRFQRPRQYFLQGDVNATIYPPPCVQPVPGQNKIIGDEDCLFLNIFTPNLPDGTEGLPVVVWIHGGGFRFGSASQYGARHLVGKRLVIVTIQYRLGSLGFLSTGTTEMPGNVGIWDMALAVQFVRNYIGFFGGNPHKIVVMGHGTGASSALLLSLSNVARGLTNAVVAMSGTSVSHGAIDDKPVNTVHEIAEQNGCPTTTVLTMIKCLQNLPSKNIIEADTQTEKSRLQSRGFVSGLSGLLTPAPSIEGIHDGRSLPHIIERKPLDDMNDGRIPKIPLLTGVTRDETKKAIEGHYKEEIMAKLQSIPHFLDNILVKNLQDLTATGKSDHNNNTNTHLLLNKLDILHFRNYVRVKKNDLREGLDKISEMTGDALFNLPAFLTVDLWSKQGTPTFLYRFDHNGKANKGRSFINGLPIIGNISTDYENIVGHGDDLAYLFEAKNLDGSDLENEELNENDKKVRDTFTQLIADFARFGHPNINNQKMTSFSTSNNNFIQISEKTKILNDFRYCQMALWAGLVQKLQSTTCKFLHVLDTQVKEVLFDTVNKTHVGGITQTGKNLGHIVENKQTKVDGTVEKIKPLGVLSGHKNNSHSHLGGIIG